jgi:hypothetical protein
MDAIGDAHLYYLCTCDGKDARLQGGGQEKNNWKKWWAKEEEKHKGSLTKK